MSINFIIGSLRAGGAEKVVLNLSNYFSCLGKEVNLITITSDGEYKKDLNSTVKLKEVAKASNYKAFKFFYLLFGFIKSFKAAKDSDVFMSSIVELNIIAFFSHWISNSRCKLVLREAADPYSVNEKGFIKSKVIKFLAKICYSRCEKLIANSNRTKQSLRKMYGLTNKKIDVIYNPLETKEFSSYRDDSIFNSTNYKFISVARLDKNKNHIDQIRVIDRLSKRGYDVQLDIVGIGPELELLKKEVANRGLNKKINFLGYVDKPQKLFRAYHMFFHTSLSEGFGYVLIEAMASNIPVVSYDFKGPADELICDRMVGRLVPLGDVDTFVDKVCEILVKRDFVSSGQEYIHKFDINFIGSKYLDSLYS